MSTSSSSSSSASSNPAAPVEPLPLEQQLWHAATDGNLVQVRLLLEAHPALDPNWHDPELRRTIFYRASGHGREEVVGYLLRMPRVNVNTPNTDSCSPLWMAAHDGHLQVVKLMLASGRDFDLNAQSNVGNYWGGKDAAQAARDSVLRVKYSDEDDVDYERARIHGIPIANLLDEFKRDPVRVRRQLMQEPTLLWNRYIGEIFALVVFLSDSYVRLKPEERPGKEANPSQEKTRRFFKIALGLHMDLQMVLCNRLYSSASHIVPRTFSEPAFARYGKKSSWPAK